MFSASRVPFVHFFFLWSCFIIEFLSEAFGRLFDLLKKMRGVLQHPGLYNRDPRLGFSPLMSPLGGGDMLDPVARLGRASPYGLMRGGGLGIGGLGMGGVGVRGLGAGGLGVGGLRAGGLGVGGLRAGMLGERGLGVRGRGLHPAALLGNRGVLGMGIHGDPLSQALQLSRYPSGVQPRLSRLGGLGPLGLVPYQGYLGGGWPHGAECDTCLREQLFHQHQGHLDHGCGCRRSCDLTSNSNTKSNFDFKTKDVTVRGKARAVRESYLTEASKFESDLTKYMEKKKEEDVPDRVVDMLISFINREEYSNSDIVDEVTLNILASNVGAKSTVNHSLSRLKKIDIRQASNNNAYVICQVLGLITQSGKVDDGLRKWLENSLTANRFSLYNDLFETAQYREMAYEHPEVVAEVERMVGERKVTNDGIRSI